MNEFYKHVTGARLGIFEGWGLIYEKGHTKNL